ncbi:hypothetical protein A2164_01780 [Candidatus Curtissbacteria bacterium RBG_13_35_7]|uniref:Uncharacterized protein n=1 Tax=Candidatus Curtissbacteria bacterium RBG_13_35_7 TaxID=1797705 RepID=A0A1F5G412_9BACT|nr:MAG: hypothetical protein A2164_01780 [Candidatus Curtissbacteria bacterium RBG_13_35_7]
MTELKTEIEQGPDRNKFLNPEGHLSPVTHMFSTREGNKITTHYLYIVRRIEDPDVLIAIEQKPPQEEFTLSASRWADIYRLQLNREPPPLIDRAARKHYFVKQTKKSKGKS